MPEQKIIGFNEVFIDSQIPSVDIYRAVLDERRRVDTVREKIYVHEVHIEYFGTFSQADWERLKTFKNQVQR